MDSLPSRRAEDMRYGDAARSATAWGWMRNPCRVVHLRRRTCVGGGIRTRDLLLTKARWPLLYDPREGTDRPWGGTVRPGARVCRPVEKPECDRAPSEPPSQGSDYRDDPVLRGSSGGMRACGGQARRVYFMSEVEFMSSCRVLVPSPRMASPSRYVLYIIRP